MRKFRKYEFDTRDAAQTKIDALGVADSDGVLVFSDSFVQLGNIVTQQPTYNEDGSIDTPAVLSDKWHVDVLWAGEPDESWDDNLVWMAGLGVHSFGSSDANAEYIAKARELHPELFPEPEEVEE